MLILATGAALAQPTVNGLFYGDGDNTLYSPYATSQFGSVLYNYYDASANVMYVALVVSHAVNDNVCSPKANKDYTASATPPWSQHRSCKRASDSEFASWTLECAPGSPRSWAWQQAVGCAQTAGPPPSNWVSNSSCGPSSPAANWPPGVEAVAITSWVANINRYQAAAPATRAWNLYAFGTDIDGGWKSPFIASAADNVTMVPGYPTYSTTNGSGLFYEWEWSTVYEWSVDLGPGGTDCGNNLVVFITGNSHHSPGKHGSQDDPFDPPPGDQTFSDFGDLPNSYATTVAAGGARHYIKVNAPYLGQNLQAELDGQPTADASGDGSEEDGVTANVNGNWTAGSTQTFSVVVTRAPVGGVLLGGWFDWNHDGDFNDAGEFVSWSGLGTGTHTLSVTVGASFNWQTDSLSARFRVFSSAASAPGGSLDAGDFAGTATDGEVEDYIFQPGTLPVTLNAFASDRTAGSGLIVRWQTATETDNVGFELSGRVAGKWRPLAQLVPSAGMNSGLPHAYEAEIDLPPGLTELELVNYDSRGRPERFGPFQPGSAYGEFQPIEEIDWTEPRAQRAARLQERGFSETTKAGQPPATEFAPPARWRKLSDQRPGGASATLPLSSQRLDFEVAGGKTVALTTGAMTHVAVTEPGIQRVSYEALRNGGLDLAGVRQRDIALTWRGQPVARWIGGGETFGSGSSIEFIGQPPRGDDALYLEANLYQVSVDRTRARAARRVGRSKVRSVSASYPWQSTLDRPTLYHRQSPTGEPWVERSVLVTGATTVTLEIPVAGPVLSGPTRLRVELGTVTDLPDLLGPNGQVIPEHNVELWFSGPDSGFVYLTTASTSGQQDWQLEADIPPGLLKPGSNWLELRFDTDYLFSLVLIDRYGVEFPGPYLGPELNFGADPSAEGYRVEGFSSPAIVAYAEKADGSLTRIEPRVTSSAGGFAAELRQLAAASRFWVDESPHAPAVFTTHAPADLLAGPADLVVIADSSFIGTSALDDYLAATASFNPAVIDVEDIYNGVGFGMELPGAITDYLRLRNEVSPFTHVQLVGADCYDRLNRVSDCLSFIPLPTAPVGVTIYSPSQNRLVDLDGDGIGDKAVAQFSVRDETELATIVEKGSQWRSSGLWSDRSALFISEETDGTHSFQGQTQRLRQRLGWARADMLDMADHPDVATARQALGAALAEGRTVTVFSGHSSPTVWAYRSLLTASAVGALTNFGLPTLMVPLACESTYDISPNANVLGHQLLYAGNQGALAISGAVALSSLDDNERMAAFVLDGLRAGLTLGQAVQAGRVALGSGFQALQDNWMTQGDVTTRISP